MTDELRNFLRGKLGLLVKAAPCCAEAKDAANAWLAAAGTDGESAATAALLKELEEDIEPIDGLIEFASSETAVQIFGKEAAGQALAHAKELKAAGAECCDCEACALCAEILAKKDELLGA